MDNYIRDFNYTKINTEKTASMEQCNEIFQNKQLDFKF